MKIVVVSASIDALPFLKAQASLAGCHFVQYGHPLKALDNLAEIDPDLILWNADDYPRHWKICRAFCPDHPSGEAAALILVSEHGLSAEETDKAAALDIDELVSDGFMGDALLSAIQQRLGAQDRLAATLAAPGGRTDSPTWPQGTGTLFLVHPDSSQIVVGSILESDGRSLSVRFGAPSVPLGLAEGLVIAESRIAAAGQSRNATLRVGAASGNGTVRFLILQTA